MVQTKSFLKSVSGGLMAAVLLVTSLPALSVNAAAVQDDAKASGFAGGSGTAAEPYQISTAPQLFYFAEVINADTARNYDGTYFKLKADITLNDTANWEKWGTGDIAPSYAWTPVGAQVSCGFRGVFDGDGHTISGVYINAPEADNQGLFGVNLGTVQNLNLAQSYICGKESVGGICGMNGESFTAVDDWAERYVDGKLLNCTSAARVHGYQQTGGLCGRLNYGVIDGCTNTGSVSGTRCTGGVCGTAEDFYQSPREVSIKNCANSGVINGETSVGGVCGLNEVTMRNCYNTGAVTGNDYGAGGVCGSASSIYIDRCFNAGAVTGATAVGGICGNMEQVTSGVTLSNCYNISAVKGSGNYVGGVCGRASTDIRNCYSAATVENAFNAVGGVCGSYAVFTLTNSFFNTDLFSGLALGEINFCDVAPVVTGKTTKNMKTAAFVSTLNGTDDAFIAAQWGKNSGYPMLRGLQPCQTGIGTKNRPYRITTAQELSDLAYAVNHGNSFVGKYFVLTNDITLNDTTNFANWDTTAPANMWTPIGNATTGFCGIFDGCGYVVSGLYCNGEQSDLGLFGVNAGTVKNVAVAKSFLQGKARVGGICGKNSGTIYSCYSTATVSGESEIGGLCGVNNAGDLTACYATGAVQGKTNVGGVCGSLASGTLWSCWSIGTVNGTVNAGGVCGVNTNGKVAKCYFNRDIYKGNGIGSGTGSAFGRTNDAMTGALVRASMQLSQTDWVPCANTDTTLYYPQLKAFFHSTATQSDFFSAAAPTMAAPTNLRQIYGNCVAWTGVKGAVKHEISLNGAFATYAKNGLYCFRSLTPGKTYTIGLRAIGANGAVSRMVEIQLTATASLAQPTGLLRSGNSLRWNKVAGAVKYCVWAIDANSSLNVQTNANVVSPSFTFTALVPGKKYRLRVCAIDANGNYGKTATTAAFTYTAPVANAPRKLRQVYGNCAAWGAVSGAQSYEIYLNGSYATTTYNTLYCFQSLTKDKRYTVGVKAIFADGTVSEMASVKLDAVSMLARPAALKRSANTLRWSKVSGAVKYRVWVIDAQTKQFVATNANVTGTSYTFKTLESGKKYQLRVCAIDKNGCYGKSATTATFTA